MIAFAWLAWCAGAVAVLARRFETRSTEPLRECTRCKGVGFTGGTWVPLLTCPRCCGVGVES